MFDSLYGKTVFEEFQLREKRKNMEFNFKEVTTFTGEVLLYDDTNHIYLTPDKEELTSGSTFPKKFAKPFPASIVKPALSKKYGVDESLIQEMWSGRGKVSRTFGNTIHYAMEQFWLHKDHACDDKEYHFPKHKILRDIVESFPEIGTKNKIIPEPMVSAIQEKMVGQIDAIEVTGEKECNLWDYKTDAEMDSKHLKLHMIQLSFYAHVLSLFGWKVNQIIVWNLGGEGWKKHTQEPIELSTLKTK